MWESRSMTISPLKLMGPPRCYPRPGVRPSGTVVSTRSPGLALRGEPARHEGDHGRSLGAGEAGMNPAAGWSVRREIMTRPTSSLALMALRAMAILALLAPLAGVPAGPAFAAWYDDLNL